VGASITLGTALLTLQVMPLLPGAVRRTKNAPIKKNSFKSNLYHFSTILDRYSTNLKQWQKKRCSKFLNRKWLLGCAIEYSSLWQEFQTLPRQLEVISAIIS
jgi:hypothetical protein